MDFTNLKNCLNDLVEKYNTPSVDCMVYRDHEPVFRYFTGMRDLENGIKMDGNELSLTYFQHVHNWKLQIQTELRNALYSCID